MLRRVIFLFFSIITCSSLAQRNQPLGGYLITNYTSDLYKLQNQNWDVVQDETGVLYFANNGGVLEYDGANWDYTPVGTKELPAYSLGLSVDGIPIVGSQNEFGILEKKNNGDYGFKSLSQKYEEDEIGKISFILSSDDIRYLFSNKGSVFVLEDTSVVKVSMMVDVESPTSYDNQVYFVAKGEGLCRMDGRNIIPIRGTEKLKDCIIREICDLGDSTLIFTARKGCFITDNVNNPTTLHSKFDLHEEHITDVIKIGSKWIVGTSNEGLKIIDEDGIIINRVDKSTGLVSDPVQRLFSDRQYNLWVATSDGISKIEIQTPLHNYDYFDGINGTIEAIAGFSNRIFIGTHTGLYYLKDKRDVSGPILFEKISGIESEVWSLTPSIVDNEKVLLIGENNGIYVLNEELELGKIVDCYPWQVYAPNKRDANWFVVADDEGLIIVNKSNDNYIADKVKGISNRIRKVTVDPDGIIWAGGSGAVYKLSTQSNDNSIKLISTIKYDQSSNKELPEYNIYPEIIDGEVVFGTSDGFYHYNNVEDVFVRSQKLNFEFADSNYFVHRFNQDESGRVWLVATDNKFPSNYFIGYGNSNGEKMEWDSRPFSRRSKNILHAIWSEDGITWLGGPKGLYRYDKANEISYNQNFDVLLRKMVIGQDTIEFSGMSALNDPLGNQYVFPFSSKSYSFSFSSNNFFEENQNMYSFYLHGFNDSWTPLTKNSTFSVTNLAEGDYTLEIVVTDVFKSRSTPFSLSFKVTPPYYRTMWAYIIYVLVLVLLVYCIVKISLARLKRQNERLEQIVSERTAEVVEKNLSLESAFTEISEKNEIIEEKNKDIIDSINYAEKIQLAILPQEELREKNLPNSFVFFRPKDIVSGDFYWMQEKNGLIIFTVADCTGHGVPGAFMSMVGMSLLNEAVGERGITEPAKILDRVKEGVIKSLKQGEGSSSKDGMDASLCALDQSSRVLEYAGANNPVYIIRRTLDPLTSPEGVDMGIDPYLQENDLTLFEIKGDKMPLAYYPSMHNPFVNHRVQLIEGDSFYMSSDGFPDQFGGPKGKKYKYKTFKKTLMSINSSSLEDQHKFLEEDIIAWMGNENEQVDDICVIGVRV